MTITESHDSLIRYINDTPELLSLLYDLDLMPEQVAEKSRDYGRMLLLAAWHMTHRYPHKNTWQNEEA